MKEFDFSVEVCLGYHCYGGGEYTEGEGSIQLEDEQVDRLVSLIRSSGGVTDIDELDLEHKCPDIYEALEEAAGKAAREASYRHWLIQGYEGGYFEEPDGLMEALEAAGLFKYEPQESEDGDEEFYDEEDEEDAKDEAFCEWLDTYFESLTEKEQAEFIETYYPNEALDCGSDFYEMSFGIPQGIIDLAKEAKG